MNINSTNLSDLAKRMFYIQNVKPILNRDALFSDETSNFRIPAEPEKNSTVKIRFRAAVANTDAVYICVEGKEFQMHMIGNDEMFSYYEHEIQLEESQIHYYFRIVKGTRKNKSRNV